MKTRDIVVGFLVLVVIVVGVVLLLNSRKKAATLLPSPTPSITQKVNNAFPNINIPDNIEKAELKDVTGGESFGVATRTEIIANLPDLSTGRFYQGKLQNNQGKTVTLGNFRAAKGGFLLEYNSSRYPGYNTVLVTQGSTTILQGSF